MVAHDSAWTYIKKDGTPSVYRRYYYFCATYRRASRERCSNARTFHAAKTEESVWRIVREAALDPRRFGEALKRSRRGKKPAGEGKRLRAIQRRLFELEKRRDGLIDLAADGFVAKEELRARLVSVDAQIDALREEASGLQRRSEWAREREQNERAVLKRLEAMAPEAVDSLQGSHRRRAYAHLGLKVMVHQDKGRIITWFVDQEIGRIGCHNERTSTR
jgi:DNA repair exonuclease SbcCD ATPase subunit